MHQNLLISLTLGVLMASGACQASPSVPGTDPDSAANLTDAASASTTPQEQLTQATSSTAAASESAIAQANVQTYAESGIPVMAQYPESMDVFAAGSGEGVGVFFRFQPQGNALDDAEVHVFLPAGTATAADLEPFITGPNGLIAGNGWFQDSITEGNTDQFPYPWVKQVINFSTDFEQSGQILLGDVNNQAIQVTLLYPTAMADAYWSDAKLVLDSLQFDTEALPLTAEAEPGVITLLERPAYDEVAIPTETLLVGPDPVDIALLVFGTSEAVEGNFLEDVALMQETPELAIVGLVQLGVPDDSVQDVRYRLEFVPDGDQWRLNWAGRQVRCRQGRGSQDWTNALCS